MRKSYPQSIDQVVNEYLKALKIDKKLLEIRTANRWDEIIGKKIANATTKIYVEKQKLYVFISSPVIKQELFIIKDGIIKRFNELAGEQLINDIIFK
ncbi:MAG TPA: DUF721 domain-containing protein [Bacteroidales bacterium]|nr:MAG: hypothetical protein A2W98_07965 [Bacteroidetes bacterium GWF2_33_38]OFY88339.1 MAG: hypothetical protein A2236_01020 [Bacteroidetes bacterium RIFOXYA2_FULL_33_7]HBF87336.1 DUF721 domain-containing protein [Bacteroidales bacterium]